MHCLRGAHSLAIQEERIPHELSRCEAVQAFYLTTEHIEVTALKSLVRDLSATKMSISVPVEIGDIASHGKPRRMRKHDPATS